MPTSAVRIAPGAAQDREPRYPRVAYIQLVLVVFIWAVNWVFVKTVLGTIDPLRFTAIRFLGSAGVLLALVSSLKVPVLPVRGERLYLAFIGLLQIAGLMGLGTVALQYTTVGRGTVLTYTMQLWALPIGWLITREPIKPLALAGGLVGFMGIVMFLNPLLVDWSDHRAMFGNALMILSAINWALASCLYRRRRWQTPFWTQIFWQILWSALLISMAAVFTRPHQPTVWSWWLIAVVLFNWFVPSCLCYWWWSKVLTVMPASHAGQVMSSMPILTLLMGVVFLGESLTVGAAASMAVIGVGMFLTLRSK